uniref:FYVE-type domain-containing protein n=1 Tax=Macrostomum lignano TaxID=282301 RepID=A0A1I8IXS2_9PLAT
VITDYISDSIAPSNWVPNSQIEKCHRCGMSFLEEPDMDKHHCRSCGQGFCHRCSNYRAHVSGYGSDKVRVCETCYSSSGSAPASVVANDTKLRQYTELLTSACGSVYSSTAGAIKSFARPSYWQRDDDISQCSCCEKPFHSKRSIHHCRRCGMGVCDPCSPKRQPVPARGWDIEVRPVSGNIIAGALRRQDANTGRRQRRRAQAVSNMAPFAAWPIRNAPSISANCGGAAYTAPIAPEARKYGAEEARAANWTARGYQGQDCLTVQAQHRFHQQLHGDGGRRDGDSPTADVQQHGVAGAASEPGPVPLAVLQATPVGAQIFIRCASTQSAKAATPPVRWAQRAVNSRRVTAAHGGVRQAAAPARTQRPALRAASPENNRWKRQGVLRRLCRQRATKVAVASIITGGGFAILLLKVALFRICSSITRGISEPRLASKISRNSAKGLAPAPEKARPMFTCGMFSALATAGRFNSVPCASDSTLFNDQKYTTAALKCIARGRATSGRPNSRVLVVAMLSTGRPRYGSGKVRSANQKAPPDSRLGKPLVDSRFNAKASNGQAMTRFSSGKVCLCIWSVSCFCSHSASSIRPDFTACSSVAVWVCCDDRALIVRWTRSAGHALVANPSSARLGSTPAEILAFTRPSGAAIYFLDIKGKVLISRNYRGDVPMSIIEKFMPLLMEREEDGTLQPILPCEEVYFLYIKHSNVYIVATTRKNSNASLVFTFLHKVASIFIEYFKDLEEESIRDNFVIIYELLDEVIDFGFPQTTDTRILQEYITQECHKLEVAPKPPPAVTNQVSWRPDGIKYRKNEVFLDVIENVNLLVSASGNVLQSEINGFINLRTYLSGMPELQLGLNDKVLFESTGRGRNKSVELEDVKFHQCVRLSRFESDRTISFVPPDGEFELMSYRLNTHVKPLIWVESVVERHVHSRVEYMVKAKSQFKRRSTANNVDIIVPVPQDVDSPKFKTTAGSCRYEPETNSVVWSIKSFPGGKEHIMRAHFGLPSVETDELEARPPVSVRFEIPYFTVSGIQVRYLKVFEKSGYQALPWVRYITQNGDYQLRSQ